MHGPRPLPPGGFERTLVARLGPVADNLRQIATNLGARPYRVFLVWTLAGGAERGEGVERVVHEEELLPTPLVQDLTSLALQPYSAGKLPVGSVRVTAISTSYGEDVLAGTVMPDGRTPDKRRGDFFYELREVAAVSAPCGPNEQGLVREPERKRFRLLSGPFRPPTRVGYEVVLERSSEDRTRAVS
jgi:hypothetical protein